MASLRALVKGLVERVLLMTKPSTRLQGGVLVLAYHNIVPRGARPWGDASLHLPQDTFGRQLDLLADLLDVVPLATAIAAPPDRAGRPRGVITWDDAYSGAVTAGVEEVARRGLPATMFVAPGYLDGGVFWWDALAGDAALAPAQRKTCLEDCRGRQELVRACALRESWPWREPPDFARGATALEVAAAAATPGISLGSHTWSHPNLTRATPEELSHELTRARDWLEARAPGAGGTISYPYGLASPAVEAEAARAGYRTGLLIAGGAYRPDRDRSFAIPRLNIPSGLSLPGFQLRLLGRFLQ
jgi:peptidoglycan/xylan/chitin deacetylase (PgdA/CDA1 family)